MKCLRRHWQLLIIILRQHGFHECSPQVTLLFQAMFQNCHCLIKSAATSLMITLLSSSSTSSLIRQILLLTMLPFISTSLIFMWLLVTSSLCNRLMLPTVVIGRALQLVCCHSHISMFGTASECNSFQLKTWVFYTLLKLSKHYHLQPRCNMGGVILFCSMFQMEVVSNFLHPAMVSYHSLTLFLPMSLFLLFSRRLQSSTSLHDLLSCH